MKMEEFKIIKEIAEKQVDRGMGKMQINIDALLLSQAAEKKRNGIKAKNQLLICNDEVEVELFKKVIDSTEKLTKYQSFLRKLE